MIVRKVLDKVGSRGDQRVCGLTVEDFITSIARFHGFPAPGVVLGGVMVDWARELIGPEVEADAIVETRRCLPDAIQLFTPCTLGNGWMKVLDWDKFALCLFDRKTSDGIRIWYDPAKAESFPLVHSWFMRRVPKREIPLEDLIPDLLAAGRRLISSRAVKLTRLSGREKKGDIAICPGCGETGAVSGISICASCGGEPYYE